MSTEQNKSMPKKELVRALYDKLDRKLTISECEDVVDGVLDIIAETLQNGRSVRIPPMGSMHIKQSAPKMWRSKDGTQRMVTPKPTIKFKVSADFRNTLEHET